LILENKNEPLWEEFIKKLIPEKIIAETTTLSVTGLKNLYYNYPKNLWAISCKANTSKGKRSPVYHVIKATSLRLVEKLLEKGITQTSREQAYKFFSGLVDQTIQTLKEKINTQ